MIRKIVSIDENKCDGCGLCATACHEGAIEIIDNKAKLISDEYCDGLGDCLPNCPKGAISIIERESKDYDEEAVKKKANKSTHEHSCSCPGSSAKIIKKIPYEKKKEVPFIKVSSELSTWPVQLKLVNPGASYFEGAHLLIAADCTAYAYGNIHEDFIKGRVTLIGCPKLDDAAYYKEKIQEILENNDIKSVTVLRMEVPCCGGIVRACQEAMLDSRKIVPYREVVIGTDGSVK